MIGPKGEKVCLISCSGCDNQRGEIRSDTAHVLIAGTTFASLPVSPVLTPPQYTVQLLGLDWLTTSSKHNCLELPAPRTQMSYGQSPRLGSGAASACTATHFHRWPSGLGAFLWPSWFEFVFLLTTDHPSAGWRSPHPGTKMSHCSSKLKKKKKLLFFKKCE